MSVAEKKIKGGTIVGLVEEPKPADEPKAEVEAPKKRTRKTEKAD